MKKFLSRVLVLMLVAALAACCFVGNFGVSAASPWVIQLDNSNTSAQDINPFIRFQTQEDQCKTGGPFTVSLDIKVSGFRNMKGYDNGSVFVSIWHPDFGQNEGVWKTTKNCDWTTVTVEFNEFGLWVLSGVGNAKYMIIDIGCYAAKCKISVRNFTLKNAAGEVLFSYDTYNALHQVTDLRDIATVDPVAQVLPASYGASGNSTYPVSQDSSSSSDEEENKGPVIEDDKEEDKKPADTTSKPADTTSKPADTTSKPADTTSKPADTDDDTTADDPADDTTDDTVTDDTTDDTTTDDTVVDDTTDDTTADDTTDDTTTDDTNADDEKDEASQTVTVVKKVDWVSTGIAIGVGVVILAAVVVAFILLFKKMNAMKPAEAPAEAEEKADESAE